jgi:hypothetical protein
MAAIGIPFSYDFSVGLVLKNFVVDILRKLHPHLVYVSKEVGTYLTVSLNSLVKIE